MKLVAEDYAVPIPITTTSAKPPTPSTTTTESAILAAALEFQKINNNRTWEKNPAVTKKPSKPFLLQDTASDFVADEQDDFIVPVKSQPKDTTAPTASSKPKYTVKHKVGQHQQTNPESTVEEDQDDEEDEDASADEDSGSDDEEDDNHSRTYTTTYFQKRLGPLSPSRVVAPSFVTKRKSGLIFSKHLPVQIRQAYRPTRIHFRVGYKRELLNAEANQSTTSNNSTIADSILDSASVHA